MTDAKNVLWNTGRAALGAAVPDGGTIELAYPSDATAGSFTTSNLNRTEEVVIIDNSNRFTVEHFDIEYGEKSFTITNKSGTMWPAGAPIYVQFPLPEHKQPQNK